MKNKNIVLFSSGVSESRGILPKLCASLESIGYRCSFWRDLFKNANDTNNIALLPTLIKKIPTFDYAVLICEGHDLTTVLRNGKTVEKKTMRDNVLFEIGLCVMALGLSRTILVTDGELHLPDDLTGTNHTLAIKRIIYNKNKTKTHNDAARELAEHIKNISDTSEQIDRYIRENGDNLSPVVIGAASSTACGYINNFVFRTLEHISDGIVIKTEEGESTVFYPIDKIYFHIVLPEKFDQNTAERAQTMRKALASASVPTARNRPAFFNYYTNGNELHIIDYPTTIATSYNTARMILEMDADDSEDCDASERFVSKELSLFEATLKKLIKNDYLSNIIEEYYSALPHHEKSAIYQTVNNVVQNRLYIQTENY